MVENFPHKRKFESVEPKETITAAVLVYEGEEYDGNSHTIILMDLIRKFGPITPGQIETMETGFRTSTGRFVSRDEAYRIAAASGQLEGGVSDNGVLQSEMVNFDQEEGLDKVA